MGVSEDITDYLKTHNTCTMALSRDNIPSAHTMYYVSHGFRIYFLSAPKTEKTQRIMINPQVAVTVDEPYEDWSEIKGLQIQGSIVEVVNKDDLKAVLRLYFDKFPQITRVNGAENMKLFCVQPERIYYLDFEKGFGHREGYLVPDERAKFKWF